MVTFESVRDYLRSKGCMESHVANTPIRRNDFLEDDDVIIIPHNATFFSEPTNTGGYCEFVLCQTTTGYLKRLYTSSLQKEVRVYNDAGEWTGEWKCSGGSFVEDIETYPNLETFFAEYEGCHIRIKKRMVQTKNPFTGGLRNTPVYTFNFE